MALSANTVLEVRNGGSDTNGGGFVTGSSGTDWSLQDAAQYSVTDGVTNGTTTITSATANFGTDVVGNLIYVQGGTGSVTAGWYQITARTNSTTITVDRSTGLTAGTGVTLKIGGALASPGQAGAIATVQGQIVFVKYNATAFTATSASTNVAAGCVSPTNGTIFAGYDTTRTVGNTDANRPTFKIGSGVSTATLFAGSGFAAVANLILDGNSQTTSIGVTQRGGALRCKFQNFTGGAYAPGGSNPVCIACEFTGCSSVSPVAGATAIACEAYGNTVTPFAGSNALFDCLSYGNTGASTDGFAVGFNGAVNCVAYNNGRDGFQFASNNTTIWAANCVAEANAGYGFNSRGSNAQTVLRNCATYNNTSGRSTTTQLAITDVGAITGSGSFFANAGSNDFSLNNTAGAGALCRAAAYPPSFPRGTTANYLDVGAAQHQDAGGTTVHVIAPTINQFIDQY